MLGRVRANVFKSARAAMKSYSITLAKGSKAFTYITEAPAAEVPEAILERFRCLPFLVVAL